MVPNEAMETPHFSVFRVREGEELNELSYNLAKFHEAQDDAFVPEESLVSRNIETAAVTSEQVMESAAVSLSIPTAAPAPVERKSEGPSLFAKIVAAIKGLFASEPKEEEKTKTIVIIATEIVIIVVIKIVVIIVVLATKIVTMRKYRRRKCTSNS